MGHIQTKDQLHMGNNTLHHPAILYGNQTTKDDLEGERDKFRPTAFCVLSAVCEFRVHGNREPTSASTSTLQHAAVCRSTAEFAKGLH